MGLLTKTLNMSEDEIKSLIYKEDTDNELKDDALQLLLDQDAERISKIKEANKSSRDDQYKRGQRETAEKWEKDIRTTFGIEDDLTGDELLAKVVEIKAEGSGDGDLTDDKVKAHPVYIALQREKDKSIKDMEAEHKRALEEAESNFNNKVTKTSVNQRAIQYIRSKNPILPEDASKATKRLNLVTHELESYNFKQDGDDILVVDENGQLLTDAHNNPITFESLVDGIGDTYFDFQKPDDKGGKGGTGTGNKNDFGKGNFSRVKVPQSAEELEEALKNAKTPEERTAISQAFLKKDTAE